MRRLRLRALLAGALSASLCVALLPGLALGGPVVRERDRGVFLQCDSLTGDGGTLFFSAFLTEGSEPSVGIESYGPGDEPFVDPPTFVTSSADPTGSYVEGLVTLDVPVEDFTTGAPAGSATIEAMLVAAGPAERFNNRFGGGNQHDREAGTNQPMAFVAGSATLPDGSTFDLVDGPCTATEFDVMFWFNDPTSFVDSFTPSGATCDLVDETGVVGLLFMDIDDARTTAFVDVSVDPRLGAFAEVPMVDGRVTTPLEYVDFETGQIAGTGEIDVTIATVPVTTSYTLRSGSSTVRVRGDFYRVAGTLTAPGHEPFDLPNCFLAEATIKEIDTAPSGPKTTGTPPSNDLPSGAREVSVGTRLNQQTSSAALDMEEPTCLTDLYDEGNEVPLPIVRTVWFSIAGTGSTVTFDTAGSNFDTVVAVYTTAGDGSLELVDGACSDDELLVPAGRTRQAAVTFEAEAGTTYLIQVGGFPAGDNWGRLRVSVQ